MQNIKEFIKGLSDKELRDFASEVRKERDRRKKIHLSNAQWTCNDGLEAVLEASLRAGK